MPMATGDQVAIGIPFGRPSSLHCGLSFPSFCQFFSISLFFLLKGEKDPNLFYVDQLNRYLHVLATEEHNMHRASLSSFPRIDIKVLK
jgi:hypothetical protein